MADLLGPTRVQIGTRLSGLPPLVEEYRRLDAAVEALGERASKAPVEPPASSAAPTSARARAATPAQPRKGAPRGANRKAVLRAVAERPGATGGELAAISGVEPTTLNGLMTRLVKAGELQTRQLPARRTGYALGDARRAASAGAVPVGGESADKTNVSPIDSAAE